MGNYSSKPTIALDRAFMRYEPSKNLSLDAGRFDSPFVKTDLTWADDLMFDGLALTARAEPKPGSSVFAVAGAFPLKEFENSTQDKWLFGAQMGARLKITDGTQLSLALASYNFANLEGVREQGPRPNPTAPYLQSEYASQIRQKGNTLININMPGAVDDKGKVIKTQKDSQRVLMPRTEKRVLIMLNGGSYGYGGYIDTGEEEKSSIETAETLKDKIKRRFRKTRTQVIRGKYIEKIPQQEDADEFNKVYFALQKLVQQGVLTPPVTGNDGPTLNDFFWESTRPMEVSELVKLFRERGIAVEK